MLEEGEGLGGGEQMPNSSESLLSFFGGLRVRCFVGYVCYMCVCLYVRVPLVWQIEISPQNFYYLDLVIIIQWQLAGINLPRSGPSCSHKN